MAAFEYNIKNADQLNTTDFGVGFHIPFGVKVFYKNNLFINLDFLRTLYLLEVVMLT